MTTVNIHHAKTHLSKLLEQVQLGDSVIIANAGRPVAMLTPIDAKRVGIAPPGSLAGLGYWRQDRRASDWVQPQADGA